MSSESTSSDSLTVVKDEGSGTQKKLDLLKFVLQLFHLVVAAAIFLVGIVEFSVEPSIFDVFGKGNYFLVNATIGATSIGNKSLGHILDAPILFLFLIYFLSVLWLKCRGRFAWLLTASQVLCIFLYISVNAGLSATSLLDWRYFSTRAVVILLDVLILSFAWTVIVVTLLHIRGWFPFKVKKYRDIPYPERSPMQKVVVIIWNFIALYMVLSLCLLIWFSKLYMSWACVRHAGEILLMCQFTNLVQCWPCLDYCNTGNITQCINTAHTYEQIRCISPLYLTDPFDQAFCVFNYNIGPFTFVTVFSYVGGIYFFMRTVLNALVKCLFSILYVAAHFIFKIVNKKKSYNLKEPESVSVNHDLQESTPDNVQSGGSADVSSDPRVSLLGPLPHYYSSSTSSSTAKNKSKYV